MKAKYIAYAVIPVIAVAILGTGVASARGFGGFGGGMFGGELSADDIAARHEVMFAEHASLLGLSVDAVKSAWAEGKSLWELAEANGITKDALAAKMKEARTAQMKTHLQALVTKGVITQAQADQRLTFTGNQAERMGNKMFRGPGF
jgi:hypothetical protein